MNGNINHKRQGYTLLEILVVLALLSIIASVAIPSFNVIYKLQEKKEMSNIKRDILYARNNAISNGSTYTFHLDDENNYYIISSKGKIVKRKDLKYWKVLPGNTFHSNIRFFTTGSPNRSGTFALENKEEERTELRIVPVTGKVNLYKIR